MRVLDGVPSAGAQRSAREDAAVRRSAPSCAMCQRSLRDGSQRDARDVFICAQCQADAKQLFEIQDRIWAGFSETGGSVGEPDDPTPL